MFNSLREVISTVSPGWPSADLLSEQQLAQALEALSDVGYLATRAVSTLQLVVRWLRKPATKLLVFKAVDFCGTRSVTIARFGVSGQMKAAQVRCVTKWQT